MDRPPRTAAIVVLLLLVAAALVAGCTQQQPLTVKFTDHPTYGTILTDSTGRSLYIQARDVPNTGAIANLGEVGHFYPPFYAESVVAGNGINVSEFGYLTRADGKRQTTFRGWPLYYYLNDKVSGDAKSQGANNITFLAKPDYTVMVRENATRGIYLSDTTGAALLVRDNGTATVPPPGYSAFRASPVLGPAPLVQPVDFAEIADPSGGSQTTYRGQPLFLYSGQGRPGAITGDTDGYRPVVLATTGGTFTSVVEVTPATPGSSPSVAGGDTVATTTVPVTATETAVATTARAANDVYTGGAYTPTPYQTVQVVGQSTESATPVSTWTSLPTEATPLPNISAPPTTLSPATTTKIVTPHTTAVRTTTVPTTKTLSTTVPTTSVKTTKATTVPTTSVKTTKVTTVPIPITITSPPTTLPLPFQITMVPTTVPYILAASTPNSNES